jgi:aspartate racemase
VSPANSTQDALRKAINDRPGLRWIDIAQPVMSELSNRRSRRALLLATDATLASGLYHAGAGASGIEMITPDPIAQRSLNNLIVERLVCGEKTIADREFVVSLIAKGRERGADCVILGCTELCLLASDQNSALPVIDSNELLARAVVAALE